MHKQRNNLSAAVAVTAVAALALGVAPSHAAPLRGLGPVSDLAVSITKPDSYRLAATWGALERATSYKVTLSSAGDVLASDRVTTARWVVDRNLQAGSTVRVKVVPYAAKRPGKAATVSAVVPDKTAPVGTYAVALDSRTATVTENALSDDLSPSTAILREIDWDAGAGWEAWTNGTTTAHTYPEGKAAYHPRVRLTDEAGNVAVVALAPVAIDDTADPQGSFSVAPGAAWVGYTKVTMTQVGELSDDVSAPGDIARTVTWADGSTTSWATGTTVQHVYTTAGSFAPVVTLTDEAGRSVDVATSAVTVRSDTVALRASLTRPAKARSVRSWKPLRGKATDVDGSGVSRVTVRVVEKRGGQWFAYRAPSRSWVKASTRAAAFKRSRAASVVPADGLWKAGVAGLRKGKLVVKVHGRDNVGNVSKTRTYDQLLTRR